MKDYQNFYELRKTIRFILEPKEIKRPYQPIVNNDDLGKRIDNFINKYGHAIQIFRELIYAAPRDSEEKKLSKNISVKHSWLRNYTKNDFFNVKEKIIQYDKDNKKRGNKIAIDNTNIKFLNDYFENWLEENKECIANLKICLNQPEENQKKISEFAYWIRKITKRSNFEFIFELFNGSIDHKNSNEKIDAAKKELDECKPLLALLEKAVLPSQSLGVEIECASLNYYIVNKKPKDYPQEIQNKKNELQQGHSFSRNEQNVLNQVGFIDIKLPITDLKEAMKKFKAEQKKIFYEFVNKGEMYQELKNKVDLKLLNDISENNFNKFEKETDDQKRGKHFQFSFQKYKNFCNIYKNVAVKFGRIKANIKSLEREKVDAEKLQSWAVILEKDNQKYILTISRDAKNNLQNAKKYIDDLQNENGGQWNLYALESLTLRALDKLCFGSDKNTFMPAIKNELLQNDNSFFINGDLKRKDQFSEDGKELIKFYQTVLSLGSTKEMLAIDNFKNFDELAIKEYGELADFERLFKKICYYKKSIAISEDTKKKIVDDYQGNLYKITSYDLEKDDAEILASLQNKNHLGRSHPEFHTKIWLDFWTDGNEEKNYEVRLNPEFKINFVEKHPDELKDRDLGKLKKNRRLNEQFMLSTTITLNAHGKNTNLSYKTTDDIKKYIEKYNDEFNKKIKPFDIYYYGLDRGKDELLTLGLFKFSENEKIKFIKQDGTPGEYNKPEFIDLEIYQLKKEKYLAKDSRNRVAYKSIDLFLDNIGIIERISVESCIDLSCAKIVKGKIILNGDIATYLELKRVSALRKILEGAAKNKFRSDKICYNADKGSLFLNIENRGKLENDDLYFCDDRFDNILSLDAIQKELQDYYDGIKNNSGNAEMIPIEKINHLKNALCANAVGVINYLQQKYFGIVAFENLDMANKNQRISEFSGYLGSMIELKLLQKFQTLSLVPPGLKQVMSLQNFKEINQIGAVFYIETCGTSNKCPRCGTENSDKSQKWNAHAYKCKNNNCNFGTTEDKTRNDLIALDNSDKVASYNIAKKSLAELHSKCSLKNE
ncbi:MAG: hypothetical protein WC619_04465 [Patescibacteria group bacterium]